jgi:Transmembrane protein 43
MSENSYTVTSNTGWFGRIGGAIKGIFIGIILIIVSFPVLFLNEGRAVKTQKTLEEGASSVVKVSANAVDAKNEGKLVYLSGSATSEGALSDEQFKVTSDALKLRRKVEFYQWKEEKRTETKKKLGGGEETVTTYDYVKEWSERPIDSSNFHKSKEYKNPEPTLSEAEWVKDSIKLEAFMLSPGLAGQIDNFSTLQAPAPAELPAEIAGKKLHKDGSGFYLGADPATPAIGDMRVSHEAAPPGTVSVIAVQKGNTFEPFTAKAGGTIEMLSTGTVTAEAMFAEAHASNRILTWALRFLGVVLMFIGFSLLFRPLSVLADVVPFIGNIVGVGTGFVAFLLSVPLSILTISVAWVVYRPLIGVPLAIVAVVGFVFLIYKLISQNKRQVSSAI